MTEPSAEDLVSHYAKSICLILDGDPPEWLVQNFHQFGVLVKSTRESEDARGKRFEINDKLKKACGAARELKNAISDPTVLGWMHQGTPTLAGDWVLGAYSILNEIEFYAKAAAEIIPEGAGRKSAAVPGVLRAKAVCALGIIEVWRKYKNQSPSPHNRTAQRAADLFWHASGGKKWPGHADAIGSWKRPFEEALTADPTSLGWASAILFQPPAPTVLRNYPNFEAILADIKQDT